MKKLLLFFAVLLTALRASAYDFEVGGIYYNKLSDGKSVEVTYHNTNYRSYSGTVSIPSTVLYNGKTYSVTSIGNDAFEYCTSLKSVVIPNSVTTIKGYAFYCCSSLTSVTIPNSVTEIEESAFNSCSSLISVVIGNSVINIQQNVFKNCHCLKEIKSLATTPPTCHVDAFYNAPFSNITLYVPISCKSKYQSANVWRYFNIITVNDGESGVYLGIDAFNKKQFDKDIDLLTQDDKQEYFNFIDGLTIDNGTLLYYTVDQAISTLQAGFYPDDLANVAIITFTDGLDQGSFMKEDRYDDEEQYTTAINNRLKNEKVQGLPIQAYSIGIRGGDVSDVDMFRMNLKKLASTDSMSKEVQNMDEVNRQFKEIAQKLVQTSELQNLTINMPGLPNGTKVRFTLDNVDDATKSKFYIEGTFNLHDKTLTEITYKGLTSASGSSVTGTVNEEIFVKFNFNDIHLEAGNVLNTSVIKEWTFVKSNSTWQVNSEYKNDKGTEIITSRQSAAIMLVLDSSSSLGSDFENIQKNAKDFIRILLGEDIDEENSINPIYVIESDAPAYNLQGLRVSDSYKGIVIKNGKKILKR